MRRISGLAKRRGRTRPIPHLTGPRNASSFAAGWATAAGRRRDTVVPVGAQDLIDGGAEVAAGDRLMIDYRAAAGAVTMTVGTLPRRSGGRERYWRRTVSTY
jgi:hypothetical protein